MARDTDNFDRANTANPNGGRGASWTGVSGAFLANINTNESEANNAGDPCLAYRNTITPGTTQDAAITLRTPLDTLAGGGAGPAVYVQTGADSAYVLRCNIVAAERYVLARRVGGFETIIATFNATAPAAGDVVRLTVFLDGNNDPVLNALKNEVGLGSPFPFTDTDPAAFTSGRVGDFGLVVNDLDHWDNWEGGDSVVATSPDPILIGQRRFARAA